MNPYWIVAIANGGTALLGLGLWFLLGFGQRRIERIFIRDMAQNHLRHIYHALKMIAEAEGVELEEPPPIQFVDLKK